MGNLGWQLLATQRELHVGVARQNCHVFRCRPFQPVLSSYLIGRKRPSHFKLIPPLRNTATVQDIPVIFAEMSSSAEGGPDFFVATTNALFTLVAKVRGVAFSEAQPS